MTGPPQHTRDPITTDLVRLVNRLARDYRDVAVDMLRIVAAVQEADASVVLLGLHAADERMPLTERVARQQLDLLTGRAADSARLMTLRQPSRRRRTDCNG